MEKKIKSHKLSIIPTAYVETDKIIGRKALSGDINDKIDKLELKRRAMDEEAILEILNDQSQGKRSLVKMVSVREKTFQNALGSLLSIRSTEAFDTMMLLFEYMEKNKTYRLDKLTGTELLNFGKVKSINQERRHNKLNYIVKQSNVKIHILDPEKSLENYKNKKSKEGLVYKVFDLIRIKEITYSKTQPDLIVKLGGVELLPEYIDHIHHVSRRYLPLESIRKIPEEKGQDKSRHFLYKLCFKFAGSNKNQLSLTLEECMNIGSFYNRDERSLKKKWKPIEKALLGGTKVGLISYTWAFKVAPENQQDKFATNLFGEITNPKFTADGTLEDKYYKYIDSVIIRRLYDLGSRLNLPFNIEDQELKREPKGLKLQI